MKNQTAKGIILILLSALFVTVGQLCWKLSSQAFYFLVIGFVLYAFGALLMIIAFKYGELSVLHPMLSVSYVLAIIVGYFVLGEQVTPTKIIGVLAVIAGMIFLGLSGRGKAHE